MLQLTNDICFFPLSKFQFNLPFSHYATFKRKDHLTPVKHVNKLPTIKCRGCDITPLSFLRNNTFLTLWQVNEASLSHLKSQLAFFHQISFQVFSSFDPRKTPFNTFLWVMSTGMQATWYIPRPFKIIPSYWLILGGLSRAKCTCKTIHKKESLISVSTSFNTLVLFYLDQAIHQISTLRILVYFSTASRSLFSTLIFLTNKFD